MSGLGERLTPGRREQLTRLCNFVLLRMKPGRWYRPSELIPAGNSTTRSYCLRHMLRNQQLEKRRMTIDIKRSRVGYTGGNMLYEYRKVGR